GITFATVARPLGEQQETHIVEAERTGTLINDGAMIWAGTTDDQILASFDFRGSYEGGAGSVFDRGVAIDTSDAPNQIDIIWRGNNHWGRIFGDVVLQDEESILVEQGVTSF